MGRPISGAARLAAARPGREYDKRDSSGVPHASFVVTELLLLILVAALALLVRYHPGAFPGDVAVERGEQHLLLPHHALTILLENISTIGWPIPAAITLGVFIVLFLLLRRWLDALVSLVTAVAVDELTFLLSKLVHRPRPHGHGIHILKVINSTYSFPSGHVVHVTAVFGLLLFLTFRARGRIPEVILWLARVALLFFIVAMGPSRILEGEHWPSDVLTGYLWGLFWAVLAVHVYLWARRRFPRLAAPDVR